jgi:hypothetical protein
MTFTIKVRGGAGPMLAEYECPVHGRFAELVTREANGDPPATARCPQTETVGVGQVRAGRMVTSQVEQRCGQGRWSPWRISAPAVHTQFVISATQGKSSSKPHPEAMDTRMLAEGRKNDFRRQRKKLREERRHKRVKELLR